MKDKLSPKLVVALGALAVVLAVLVGWFALVSPQHSKAAKLDGEIADARTQLALANQAARPAKAAAATRAQVKALSAAMPDSVLMSKVLRQLQRSADATGVRLDSVAPQQATIAAGYETFPITVMVSGRYFGIERYLAHLRTQTRVAGDHVRSTGRLFSVSSVDLEPVPTGVAPALQATIQLNTFAYLPSTSTSAQATTDPSTSALASAAGGTSR